MARQAMLFRDANATISSAEFWVTVLYQEVASTAKNLGLSSLVFHYVMRCGGCDKRDEHPFRAYQLV